MNDPIPISGDDKFRFSCSSDVSCFNECCKDLNQFLTPYDILRLKNHLGVSSGSFLKDYTTCHEGPETGLPVISLKPGSDSQLKCPFVTPGGCSVYEDRPSSCRTYPLIRAVSRSRETGKVSEYYALLKEPHCLGFERGPSRTVHEWIDKQGILIYNEINDMMLEIISMKNQYSPGPLDLKSGHIFYTALYDLDSFRTQILKNKLSYDFAQDQQIVDIKKNDDLALLKFSYKWIQHVLFGKIKK